MADHAPPGYELEETMPVTGADQFRALFEDTRLRIADLLLERAATVTELAAALHRPKGTIGHHVSVLEEAGLIRVVRTRKVRAIEAKYYGRTARTYLLTPEVNVDIYATPDYFLSSAATEYAKAAVNQPEDSARVDDQHLAPCQDSQRPRTRVGGPPRGASPRVRKRGQGRGDHVRAPARPLSHGSSPPAGSGGGHMSTPLGRNYWKLWTASVVSNFGDGVSLIAYPWLASAVTRNPVQIALVAVATRLPWLIFTLPAGVITDRVDRKRLVAWMDVARFVITFGVALAVLAAQGQLASPEEIAAGTAPPPANSTLLLVAIYAAALLLGIAEVLRDNSAQTLMPAIVDKENLEKANGRLWGAEVVMNSFVGPPVAGFLLAIAFSLPFFVDAGTFAVAAALIFTIGGQFRPKRVAGTEDIPSSFWGELKEGFRWLWHHPLFRPMAIVLGIINAMSNLAFATEVLFAQEILDLGAAGFGLLMTAGAAGAVIGSFAASGISKRIGQGPSLFLTLGVGAVSTLVVGLTSSATVVWVMIVLGALTGTLVECDNRVPPPGPHSRPLVGKGQLGLPLLRVGDDAPRLASGRGDRRHHRAAGRQGVGVARAASVRCRGERCSHLLRRAQPEQPADRGGKADGRGQESGGDSPGV